MVALAKACATCVGLATLGVLAATATLFGFGWIAVALAAAAVVAVLVAWPLARGYSYKRIGVRLEISPRTVESHVGAVLRKLQLTSRHEVTHWAAARGLIDDDEPPGAA